MVEPTAPKTPTDDTSIMAAKTRIFQGWATWSNGIRQMKATVAQQAMQKQTRMNRFMPQSCLEIQFRELALSRFAAQALQVRAQHISRTGSLRDLHCGLQCGNCADLIALSFQNVRKRDVAVHRAVVRDGAPRGIFRFFYRSIVAD